MNAKKFGTYVKSNRFAKGFSLADAADKIGLSQQQLINIEKGTNSPQPATFMKIVNGLGLNLREAIIMLEDESDDAADKRELQN